MINVTILGATGTIGVNTLDVIARNPERYRVHALTAHRNVERLVDQCQRFHPRYAVVPDSARAAELAARLRVAGLETCVLTGPEGLVEVASASEVDYVMAGIVGAAGLLPTLAAARAGKRVLLANKEALVMSGELFMRAVGEAGSELLPIDSEHNAIFQCMPHRAWEGDLRANGITRIWLTASGGPFRTLPIEALAAVTPAQACAHPNWVMGRKISVDSATMMNKGLEIIEACWLFNTPSDTVEVVIHPQSVIHSMVAYRDGSVLAQMGNPDMRTPIAHAMAWPERIDAGVAALDPFLIARLDFEPPDPRRFPCLGLARAALEAGGTATATLNAANEEAVDAFLNERIPFLAIPSVIEHCLERVPSEPAESLEHILAVDEWSRSLARDFIRSRRTPGDVQ